MSGSLVFYFILVYCLKQYAGKEFGTCPLVQCAGQPVLPVGLKDEMGADTVKIFCPKCSSVYHPPPVRSRSSHHGSTGAAGVDGAAFGTTFPHLFLMTFSNLVLAVDPKFIICDESVSALDVSVQAQVLNLLNDLKEEFGLTYIFISHDLSVVKYMSDRMVVMQEGKVEEMGDADQIYNSPKTEYTNRLIDAIPEGKLEDIKAHLEKKGVVVN